MEDGFRDYQSFSEEGVVSEESLPVYGIALKKLEQYRQFEEELVKIKCTEVVNMYKQSIRKKFYKDLNLVDILNTVFP